MKQLAALSTLVVLFLALSCSSGGDPAGPADTNDIVGNDGIELDVADVQNLDVPLDTEVAGPECTAGQLKCLTDSKYQQCGFVEGKFAWDTAAFCEGDLVCACRADDESLCTLVGQPCICIPQCEDRECGGDGCGGTCGDCDQNKICNQNTGICGDECPPLEQQCADGETRCNGPKLETCGNIFALDLEADACWLFGDGLACPTGRTCETNENAVDACVCINAPCGELCCGESTEVCFAGECCVPDCDGKECGSDGCGGVCGVEEGDKVDGCKVDEQCIDGECEVGGTCESECETGDTICDGLKGYKECIAQLPAFPNCWRYAFVAKACADNEICKKDTGEPTGSCVCIPNCEDKECGDDGCGGSCGGCTLPETCKEPAGVCSCTCEQWDGVTGWEVCGSDGKDYANPCVAECSGISKYTKGSCNQCPCTAAEKKLQDYCGVDMVTYPSFCALKCAIGTEDCVWLNNSADNCPEVMYQGECKVEECGTGDGICSTVFDPVCGVDGMTYWNKCYLFTCPDAAPTQVACEGGCVDTGICPDCDNTCDPVCGVRFGQEVTYANSCAMDCDGAELAYSAGCCDCGDEQDWVCAGNVEDGYFAFQNVCMEVCLAPELDYLYDLPLKSDGSPQIEVCEECGCELTEANYLPVCGEDFQTYYNDCALNCVAQTERCPTECNADDCPCPMETGGLVLEELLGEGADPRDDGRRGVCGADGFTYGNACSASYHGTIVESETWCELCAIECGTEKYEPYCCEDLVTYPSLCVAQKCNDLLEPSLCMKGKCCAEHIECDDGNPATEDACSIDGVCENN
jgi:hypothetical protein